VVKVNLLSPELSPIRKATSLAFHLRNLPVILFSISLIFFIAGIYLRVETIYRKRSLSNITQEYIQAEELTKKIKSLKEEGSKLKEDTDTLNTYLKRNLLWSEKLAQLRSLIPKEVWLSRLSLEKKAVKDSYISSLFLKGSLIPQDRTSPIGTLSMFINGIKEDKAFFKDFDNLILSDFLTETYKKTEIMTFLLEMPIKKGSYSDGPS
jgi:lambda repressor-like predicted transcriptional regulator